MRKLSANFFISLDGVVEAPETWHLPYNDDAMKEIVGAQMATADTLLLGRRTYEIFAGYWAAQDDSEPFAAKLNGMSKVVVSSTLEQADWRNSTLVRTDVAKELAELKRQPGQDILTNGSITLVRTLLRDGLVDELTLLLHPIVVGTGQRLFENEGDRKGLKLVESTTLDTGVIHLTYQPV
jgi:dihydrofolate reductase